MLNAFQNWTEFEWTALSYGRVIQIADNKLVGFLDESGFQAVFRCSLS